MTQMENVVRETSDEKKIEDWALVLASAGIEYAADELPEGGWALMVAPEDELRAQSALADFDAENVQSSSAQVEVPTKESGWLVGGLGSAALLVGFYIHIVLGPSAVMQHWYAQGSASAERILHGEIWRTVTALTLHHDSSHLLGNVVACVIFVGATSRALGPGLGGALVLLSGAVGNWLNAALHGGHHVSIGASTAIFGAVGILGGLQFMRRRSQALRRPMVAWVAIAASLGLFAMLGTGKQSDISAHVMGLLVGVLLGVLTGLVRGRRLQTVAQGLLFLCTLGAVAGCWWLALR